MLRKYLCADLSFQDIEIPTALLGIFKQTLLMPEREWDQIAMPIFYKYTRYANNSYFIIKEMFMNCSTCGLGLSRLITNKSVYYGGNGMIFDENMNPIILYTVNLSDIISYNGKWSAKATAFNLKVSPNVFTSKNILEKYIRSKMIPEIISAEMDRFKLKGLNFDPNIHPIVIVEDLSRWFEVPEKVKNVNTFDKDIKDFLSREDIIQDVIRCL